MEKITPEIIRDYVNDFFDIDIQTKSRYRHYIYARAIYYKLCRKLTVSSLNKIAKIGTVNATHATVLNGINNTFESIRMYEPIYYNYYLDALDYFKLCNRNEIVVNNVNLLQGRIFF